MHFAFLVHPFALVSSTSWRNSQRLMVNNHMPSRSWNMFGKVHAGILFTSRGATKIESSRNIRATDHDLRITNVLVSLFWIWGMPCAKHSTFCVLNHELDTLAIPQVVQSFILLDHFHQHRSYIHYGDGVPLPCHRFWMYPRDLPLPFSDFRTFKSFTLMGCLQTSRAVDTCFQPFVLRSGSWAHAAPAHWFSKVRVRRDDFDSAGSFNLLHAISSAICPAGAVSILSSSHGGHCPSGTAGTANPTRPLQRYAKPRVACSEQQLTGALQCMLFLGGILGFRGPLGLDLWTWSEVMTGLASSSLVRKKKIPAGGAIEVDPILPELFFEENVTVNSSICIVKNVLKKTVLGKHCL